MPLTVALLLLVGGVAFAVFGPWLLRRAAPALVRIPRMAIGLIVGGMFVWIGSVLAIGPVLAWAGSGPVVLSGQAADVCQRCLAAANPFLDSTTSSLVPTILFLVIPAVIALSLGIATSARMIRNAHKASATAEAVQSGSVRSRLHGHAVSVIDSERVFALTFALRDGGIVLSSGAIRSLDHDELAAVLEHEHAHLRQRHHLISSLIDGIAAYLRWVPLVAAVADAIPHYLEIAADNHARQTVGTPALVGALLKIAKPSPATSLYTHPAALYAAGPERIRHLVRPGAGLSGAVPLVAIAAYLVALGIVSVAIQIPYASAAITGCL
jgi:Zn-dependent protease with chaperone function